MPIKLTKNQMIDRYTHWLNRSIKFAEKCRDHQFLNPGRYHTTLATSAGHEIRRGNQLKNRIPLRRKDLGMKE